ncbi:MAG: hypothetical protein CR991_03050 [Proteobacteria bacterium]|nr:MAG: hypothetical protein CR991_03050 [Pseudomonadota bacterium]
MQVFLLTFIVFALVFLALSLGWLLSQKSLKGSCGGLSAIPGLEGSECSCSSPCEKRLKREAAAQNQ